MHRHQSSGITTDPANPAMWGAGLRSLKLWCLFFHRAQIHKLLLPDADLGCQNALKYVFGQSSTWYSAPADLLATLRGLLVCWGGLLVQKSTQGKNERDRRQGDETGGGGQEMREHEREERRKEKGPWMTFLQGAQNLKLCHCISHTDNNRNTHSYCGNRKKQTYLHGLYKFQKSHGMIFQTTNIIISNFNTEANYLNLTASPMHCKLHWNWEWTLTIEVFNVFINGNSQLITHTAAERFIHTAWPQVIENLSPFPGPGKLSKTALSHKSFETWCQMMLKVLNFSLWKSS